MNVTVDYLVKDQACSISPVSTKFNDMDEIIDFRLEANINTYAALMNEVDSTRLDSHDFRYVRGPLYIMTYVDSSLPGKKLVGKMVNQYMHELYGQGT